MTETIEDNNIVESGELHFSLGDSFGEMFTNLVREIAWEDCHRETAILKVMRAVHGIELTDAEAVVDGSKKFITAPDHISVGLVEDNWIPPDLEAMKSETIEFARTVLGLPYILKTGGSWYDNLDDRDQALLMIDARIAISMAEENPRKALELKRQLEGTVEGLQMEVVTEHRRMVGDAQANLLQDMQARIIMSDMPPEMAERMIRVSDGMLEGMFHGVEVAVDLDYEMDTGWLTPEGTYYGCAPGQHIPLAHKLVETYFHDEEGDAEQILEFAGWVKCTGSHWMKPLEKPLTPEQKKAIAEWSAVHGPKFKFNGREKTLRELQEDNIL